ncbi:MAG: MmcQ/YjbR family DNA-binding protein [Bacteroidota bacterium]|nr:MmcQ/YjbR family DNA-binding protein [Bacteroidota bacterium]
MSLKTVSISEFRKMALSFPEANEEPHFEKTSFRVNKKIFATLNVKENRATIKLSEVDQDLFCVYDKNVMCPVPNKWGKQGWTHINLKTIPKEMCVDALKAAFDTVSSTKKKSSQK